MDKLKKMSKLCELIKRCPLQENQCQILNTWICQVDASWTSERDAIGLGVMALEDGKSILYGPKSGTQAQTHLHAEAEGLIWAGSDK